MKITRVRSTILDGLLGACDALVVTLPSTPETQGLVGRAQLQLTRSAAV